MPNTQEEESGAAEQVSPSNQSGSSGRAFISGQFKGTSNSKLAYVAIGGILGIIVIIIVLALLLSPSSKKIMPSTISDTWIGKGKNANWSTAENWSSGVPKNNDNLIFNVGNSSAATISNNDLGTLSFYSLTFNGGKSASVPFDITGDALNVSSGGVTINSIAPIIISKLNMTSDFSINNTLKNLAVLTTGLNINNNNLSTNSATLNLNSLEGSGNIAVSKGELEFNRKDKTNQNFSGDVTIATGSQLTLNPVNNSSQLGSGSLSVDNGGELFFRLSGNTKFTTSLTLGSSSNVHEPVLVEASSGTSLTNSSASSYVLSFTGHVRLLNNVLLHSESGNSGFVPVGYKLANKPSGNFKLIPATADVKISEP